jgi:adenine phosphoribosyltransferase
VIVHSPGSSLVSGVSDDAIDWITEALAPVEVAGEHDLWGLYRDARVLRSLPRLLSEPYVDSSIDVVMGAEARGFLIGGLVAEALGVAFVPARKPGAFLPGKAVTFTSAPDWEGKRVEFSVQHHALEPGQRVLMVDDWYTTGNQGRAIAAILTELRCELVGTSVIVEESRASSLEGLGSFSALLHWSPAEHEFKRSQWCRLGLRGLAR